MPTNISTTLLILQLILAFGNVCILGYGFVKFLGKPHNNLETRVTALEVKIKDMETSLNLGNDKFRELGNATEVLLRTTIALVDFEIQYCLTENKPVTKNLENAREELHSYLSRK